MASTQRDAGTWVITLGGALFIAVLFISAVWEPDIRWLHFFQAWMYLAAIALSWRGSRWGYFIGFGAAALWNYTSLCVNTFLKNGLEQATLLLHTGHLARPDAFISVPGWAGNLLVIIGALLAYAGVSRKEWRDVPRLAAAAAGTTAFFALTMYVCQPRYLALFPGMSHPHVRL